MNKKVSTLLTMGLFLGGSLFNVVNAEQLKELMDANAKIEKLDASAKYFLKVGNQYLHSTKSNEKKTVSYNLVESTEQINDLTSLDNYLWYVTPNAQIDGSYGYTLKNAKTGELVRLSSTTGAVLTTTDSSKEEYKKSKSYFYWGEKTTNLSADKGYKADQKLSVATLQINGKDVYLDDNTTPGFDFTIAPDYANAFSLVKVAAGIGVDDEELNNLYNSAGFNFTLGKDLAAVENIFDGDQAVKAIYVASEVTVDEGRTFPKGTYFAVSTPVGAYPTFENTGKVGEVLKELQVAYLMDCEFIALSSTDHMSYSADDLKTGKGYKLTTISGRDLNKYIVTGDDADASKMSNGEGISVWNACFKVQRKPGTETYALSLDKARVLVSGTAHTDVAGLQMEVYSVYGGAGYLASEKADDPNFIFTFVESNVVKPTEFLKENAAAIYNIKFINKNGGEKSENDKYLFAPAYESKMYAKGEVLTSENNPEFQFLITNVDGNNITFTNRANKYVSFTAQLFKEAEGEYSLSIVDKTKDDVTVLNVNEAGDVVPNTNYDFDLHLAHISLETPESTDKFNGTWNVANESKVTLSFARDNDPTSNKVYPTVNANYSDLTGEQTTEISEAAQWQLVKSSKPKYNTQTYAFKNAKGTVEYMTLGDTVAYYTYGIQLVADGIAQNKYLVQNGNSYVLNQNNTKSFIIKENKDGSVVILNANYNQDNYLSISESTRTENELKDYLDNAMASATLTETPKAKYIKTFLLPEAPEVSFPGTEAHVTLQDEMIGNYIGMTEDRDAIISNSEKEVYYLNVTDKKAVVPSFYISRAGKDGERMFMFNPVDSVKYYVGEGKYDKTYEWKEGTRKVIFKAGQLNETSDTLTTNVKGQVAKLAMKADNKGTQGGLNRFKFQIIEAVDEAEGFYYIRQIGADNYNRNYLANWNGKLTWTQGKQGAQLFQIEKTEAPTSNESVAASEVKVIANNGSINVKNAAGKNVVVSTILGQVVANEVLTSDNATINVPAGIVVVAVDGESFKVNVK